MAQIANQNSSTDIFVTLAALPSASPPLAERLGRDDVDAHQEAFAQAAPEARSANSTPEEIRAMVANASLDLGIASPRRSGLPDRSPRRFVGRQRIGRAGHGAEQAIRGAVRHYPGGVGVDLMKTPR